jgi:hypothetical protein
MSGFAAVCDVVSASLLCTVGLGALITNISGPDKPTVEATLSPPRVAQPAHPPAHQPVRQQGRLISVSPGSVTARSANGYTQTYLVTPSTTVVGNGGQTLTAPARFTVNDQVDIVGTVQDGAALAIAVADRGNGPPMDYLPPQPVGAER